MDTRNQIELLSSAIEEIDTRPYYEIAAECVYLHGISKPGLFDWIQESRHYIGPLDALHCKATREVNLLKPVRGGGSVVGDVFLQVVIRKDPGDYFQALQTDDEVSIYGGKRTIPNIEKTSPDLLPKFYTRGEGEIKLNSGCSLYLSGPSISNMQTKMIRYMHLDEPHMYKKGTIGEAKGRLGDFMRMHLSKLLCISQAGPPPGKLLDDHDWYHHYNEGEINEWEVMCPACERYFQPKFTGKREDGSYWGVTWGQYKTDGVWDVRRCLDTVHYICENPNCSAVFTDGPKIKSDWNRTGRYTLVGKPYVQKRSFHWEAVIMDNWRDLAENWLNACNAESRGNYLPKIQFYQKYRAIFMDEMRLLQTERRFGRLVVSTGATDEWKDEFVRFMSVDVQEDHFWVLIVAWSKDGRARRLFYGKILGEGDVNDLALKYKLTTYLTGTKMHSNVFMDSAFFKRRVYSICCKFGFIAVAGANPDSGVFVHDLGKGRRVQRSYSSPTPGDPELGQHERTPGLPRFCKVIQFVKHTMSSRVFGLIDKDRIEHSTDLGPEMEGIYKEGMAARRRVTDYDPKGKRGKRVYFTEGKKDHPQDCWNMQCLGATLARILSDDPMEKEEETPA